MSKTIVYGTNRPREEDIAWFVKHVGPRTHYLLNSVGGKGWRFKQDITRSTQHWYLTVDDGKWLTYWTLMK